MNKIFKKIAAIVTAVAMIATLGITAFANYDGDGSIKITEVITNPVEELDGLYDVVVRYEVESGTVNEIGVTMLTYVGDEDLSVTAAGYDSYDATLQIVGIDQQEQDGQTGQFEFRVTTGEDNGAIKVTEGVAGVILVSGDNVSPAAATLLIEGESKAVMGASADYTGSVESVNYFNYDVIADNVKAAFDGENANIYDEDGNLVGTAGIEEADVTAVEKEDGVYTATILIPPGRTVTPEDEGTTVTIDAPLSFDVDVAVELEKWVATSAEIKGGNELGFELGDIADDTDLANAVITAAATKGIVLKDADEHTSDVTNVAFVISAEKTEGEFNADAKEEQEFTFSITVDVEAEADYAYLEEAYTIEGITVTVAAPEVNEFVIASVEPSETVDPIDVENATSEDDAIAAIKAAVSGITLTVYDATKDNSEEGWTISDDWTFTPTYDDAATGAVTYTATASIVAPEVRGEAEGINTNTIKFSVTVEYAAAASFTYGDLDGDGEITMSDATEIAIKVVKGSGYAFTDPSGVTIPDIYGELDGDDDITMSDATEIAIKVVKGSGYTFPVLLK